MSRHLHALYYSPWSEKARWALDHHGLQYRYHEHLPMLGELRLRWHAKGKARPSVPLLVDDGQVIGDSWNIIEHADRIGSGTPLLGDCEDEARQWNERCERALAAHRALVIDRVHRNPKAQEESVASIAPGVLAKVMRPVGRIGAWYLARKYPCDVAERAEHESVLVETLDTLRGALDDGREYMAGGHFSATDIFAALVLQGVEPVRAHVLRLGPATREVWTSPELASRYSDLLSWRDLIYARHRPIPLAGPGSNGSE